MKSLQIEIIPFKGWERNLRLANGECEIIITLDVGPRIISYNRIGGLNPFKLYADQLGGRGEKEWRNRGGHRLWLAPERKPFTYFPDNASVAWKQIDENTVRVTPAPERVNGYQKEMDISLAAEGSAVKVVHRVTRWQAAAEPMALWGLSVMAPGGEAIVPQPEPGVHPRDLLPNRNLVVWPYTNLADPRWQWNDRFIAVRHETTGVPFKVGFAHRGGWAGYRLHDLLFIKEFPRQENATYPDDGCNLEIFTNGLMLELESLGPMVVLATGESAEHVEHWSLVTVPGPAKAWREWAEENLPAIPRATALARVG